MTVSSETLRSISTPEQLESRLGTLEFVDGVPSGETVETVVRPPRLRARAERVPRRLRGSLDVRDPARASTTRACDDNTILIFSELMGSESLFLTANADTVYFLGFVDLTSGPMVVETPPQALGVFDDMWWGWIIDFGLPGPDRGEGGRFLLVPPGYDGPLPDSGYHVGHSRTTRALLLGRSFLTDDDPAPTVATIKRTLKIYPYAPGGAGTSVATLLEGDVPPGRAGADSRDGVRGGQREGVQHGAAERLRLLRADERGGAGGARRQHEHRADGAAGRDRDRQGRAVRARRADAAHPRGCRRRRQRDLAGAVLRRRERRRGSRTTTTTRRGSTCCGSAATRSRRRRRWSPTDGIKPFPATGVRKLHSRTSFLYAATGVTPAMCMRLTGIGSQYLMAVKDADGNRFDGAQDLPGDAAAGHPGGALLVAHRSTTTRRARCSQTPQRFPRAGSQSYPTPAATANADGSTTVTFGPERPADSPEGNWIQTDRGQGLVPDPAPLQPARAVLRQDLAAERDRARRLPTRTHPNINRREKHHVRIRR